ncbi:MAG: hypothetical protein EBS06_04280 [Proteobacteria bacterium]|nr:hypothetical protein [Pseudomonadota bacterium]
MKTANTRNQFFNKKNTAFSLIEISIVIIIVGLLISVILASSNILDQFKISTARTLTVSSPVNGIKDSVLWLESSLKKSFDASEQKNGANITAWYDIRESVSKNNAVQSNSSNYPIYSNTTVHIHAVKFDGVNSYLNIANASFLNNTDYTIFIVEQRESNKADNYFVGDISAPEENVTNNNLVLGYSSDKTVKHSQSFDNSYTSSLINYKAADKTPKIFSFIHDSAVGKKTYVNGMLTASSADTNNLKNISTLKIGKSYNGKIGELIIFVRALTTEERQSIEDYLGKKWSSKITRS